VHEDDVASLWRGLRSDGRAPDNSACRRRSDHAHECASIHRRPRLKIVSHRCVLHFTCLFKADCFSLGIARLELPDRNRLPDFPVEHAQVVPPGICGLRELAMAGVPTVVAYRVSLFEEMIIRGLIQTQTIVLANLVLGENVMPELHQRDVTGERLAATVIPLLERSPQRERQLAAFRRIDDLMQVGRAIPSARAADIVLAAAIQAKTPLGPTASDGVR